MSFLRLILFLSLGLSLAACARSDGLDGTYTASGPAFFQSLTFKPDGKVEIVFMRNATGEGSYAIDGTSVKITVQDKTQVLALDANGCLDGGTSLGKYCKATGSGSGTVSAAKASSSPGSIGPVSPQPLATEPVVPSTAHPPRPAKPDPRSGKTDSPAVAAAILAPSPMLGAYVATGGKGVTMTLEFLDARNVRMSVAGGGPTAVQEGTYKMDTEGHILVTIQNDTAEFSKIDGGLEGKLDNAVVKFMKK